MRILPPLSYWPRRVVLRSAVHRAMGTGMAKRKHSDALSGNRIAERLVAKMKREFRGKVVNLGNIIAGRAAAEELQKPVVTKEGLAGFHPAHAAYVYSQNQVSVNVGAGHRLG